MSQDTEHLWSRLLQAELVQGPVPETAPLESPWYVKVLLAFSGWLAAVFLLGFIAAGFIFIIENSLAALLTGGLMIAGAYKLLEQSRNEFFEHLALAMSLTGQALIVWAIVDTTSSNETLIWMFVATLEIPLAILMPNFVHRVFSSYLAALAFSMALASAGIPYIFSSLVMALAAWLWLNEFRYPQHIQKLHAIAYGLILALIQLKGSALFGFSGMTWRSASKHAELVIQPWMAELLAAGVLVYVVWHILQDLGHRLSDRISLITLASCLLLSLASMQANGITLGLVIILLGFAGSNRILLGLGIVSLLFYLSSYYYLLDTSLLAKSQTLFLVGLILLCARWLIMRVIKNNAEPHHG